MCKHSYGVALYPPTSGGGYKATEDKAKTILKEELDYAYRLIEMQLGHTVRDANGRAYNRVTWLDKRKEMMQK